MCGEGMYLTWLSIFMNTPGMCRFSMFDTFSVI